MPHSHDHGNECTHEASHTDNGPEMGIEYSLYSKIDMENLECLNEESDGSGKLVFKPYEQRLDFDKVIKNHHFISFNYILIHFSAQFVESDADEELLFNIPFTGNIKLKGLIIIGAEDATHPNKVKL